MNVVYKNRHKMPFKSVTVGEVFLFEKRTYLRLNPPASMEAFNAVILESGGLTGFNDDTLVEQVTANVVIE